MLARFVSSSPAGRVLAAVLVASALSSCSVGSGVLSTCSQSAQFGCLKTSTSPAWWLK